jgi:hypothetical protein
MVGCDGWRCGTTFKKGSIPSDAIDREKFIEWLVTKIREGSFTYTICNLDCGGGEPPVVVENPDYVVMRYFWTDADGEDLDSATRALGSGIAAMDGKVTGWRMADVGDAALESYICWGGDNMFSGQETVMLDLRALRAQYGQVASSFNVELFANWYKSKLSGNAEIWVTAYQGGTMRKTGTLWVNDGGVMILDSGKVKVKVTSSGQTAYASWLSSYTKIGYVNYRKVNEGNQEFVISIYSA